MSWFARLREILLWVFVLAMPVYVFYVRQHLHVQFVWLDVLFGVYFLALPCLLLFVSTSWSDRRIDVALSVLGKLRTGVARTDRCPGTALDEIRDTETVVQVRRAAWRERLSGKPSLGAQFGLCRSDTGLRALFLIANVPLYVVFGVNVLLLDPDHEVGVAIAALFAIGAGCFYVLVGHFRYRNCAKRLLNSINHGRCPECSYALRAHFRSKETRLHEFGPPMCTECGVQWPLLPPPLEFVQSHTTYALDSLKA